VRSLADTHIFEESMSMIVVFHVFVLNFEKKLYEKRSMLPIGSAVFIGLLTIFYIGYRNIG